MRPTAEWLMVPLLAAPLVLACGFHAWAQAAHDRDLDRYRHRGAEQLDRWTTSGGVAGPLIRAWDGGDAARGPSAAATLGEQVVRVVTQATDEHAWTFADAFPVGWAPASLRDATARIAVESGGAPVAVAPVDAASEVLFALLRGDPDREALSRADLPPATKHYVLSRWRRQNPAPWMDASAHVIDAVAAVAARPHVLAAPGVHRLGSFLLTVPANGTPPLIAHAAKATTPTIVARDPVEPDITLAFGATPPPAAHGDIVLWRAHRHTPLAGHFAFTLRGGPHWWQGSRFRPWLGPGLAALLLLLVIPAALWWAFRRRRKLDEARTRFINELAHDLRTPLTSLRLHAEMLGSGRAPTARQGHYLGLIERESSRLSALLGNLLDLSRLDGARAVLHPTALSVPEAAREAVRAFVAVHPDRADDVTTQGAPHTVAHADHGAVARVLGNLLENAGKFTAVGTPIRVSWRPEGRDVALSVADDGPGIAPEERRAVFDRYARGARAKRDGVAGSGLGLALVKELTSRMGGSVHLCADETGATFEVRLPGEVRDA